MGNELRHIPAPAATTVAHGLAAHGHSEAKLASARMPLGFVMFVNIVSFTCLPRSKLCARVGMYTADHFVLSSTFFSAAFLDTAARGSGCLAPIKKVRAVPVKCPAGEREPTISTWPAPSARVSALWRAPPGAPDSRRTNAHDTPGGRFGSEQ